MEIELETLQKIGRVLLVIAKTLLLMLFVCFGDLWVVGYPFFSVGALLLLPIFATGGFKANINLFAKIGKEPVFPQMLTEKKIHYRWYVYAVAMILAIFYVGIGKFVEVQSNKKVAVELVQALEQFHAEQGHYPEEIEELIPKYLSAKPLFYRFYSRTCSLTYYHFDKTAQKAVFLFYPQLNPENPPSIKYDTVAKKWELN